MEMCNTSLTQLCHVNLSGSASCTSKPHGLVLVMQHMAFGNNLKNMLAEINFFLSSASSWAQSEYPIHIYYQISHNDFAFL